jgi:excisionase family DNA binding protein
LGEGNGDKYEGACGENVGTEAVGKIGFGSEHGVDSSEQVAFFDNLVWLNSEEAARYLRRSVGQLRNMVHRRQLAYKKYCRRLYFRRTDLDRHIERSNNGGRSWQ